MTNFDLMADRWLAILDGDFLVNDQKFQKGWKGDWCGVNRGNFKANTKGDKQLKHPLVS